MKTFKNKHFTKRDYECTNVVFCKSETAPNDNWEEIKDFDPLLCNGMVKLWIENNAQFYGWL